MPPVEPLPRYSFPFSLAVQILIALIAGRQRDFSKDARRALAGMRPPPLILGAEQLPDGGPLLLVFNHYARPGFSIVWAAFAITAQLPRTPLWLMTRAWTKRQGGWDRLRTRLTACLFERLARVYGFVSMPAMPPDPGETLERALSVRRLLQRLNAQEAPILCLAPEGMDSPQGKLSLPHPGSGRFILRLQAQLHRIQPLGVYEEDGHLSLHFGKPFRLSLSGSNARVDQLASRQVMKKIAALLPPRLRGNIEI